ncbi:glutaredoxin 3 [Lacimicrobium alkaliphilum]|uniref:Glutaredoxin n=1 Tax=Lacimicrobium alkaliphilum TaxID=1526571 RepID=A0A0U2ZNX6_9ALTE|nr:glutaredoxin 3 [Lacimicrobium alkaliphilum]ALS99980.1 glutaredoxin [Lacimicrobium alkaliphilum]
MSRVEIYTKNFCPFCIRAKQLLDTKGIEYQEYRIDQQPGLRAPMIERAKGGYTVPQIFINDQHIGGCDEMMALDARGELDKLLAA